MIEELLLEGFQGFKHARVRFTQGLNLITGRNSTGKTSILEAIIYGVYGKLPDVTDSLLVSRLAPRIPMRLRLKFRGVDGRLYETLFSGGLTRDGGFRSETARIFVDGKPLDVARKEEIRRITSKAIGLGFKKFLSTVYVRQGRLTEILTPRREDMDAVLGIDLLRELTQQLEAARKTLSKWKGRDVKTLIEQIENREIPDKERTVNLLREKVEALESRVEELSERIEKAESPELEKLLSLIVERDRQLKSIREEETAIKTLIAQAGAESLDQLKENFTRLDLEAKKLLSLLEELKTKKENMSNLKTRLQTKADQLREEVKRHEELLEKGVATCPTCGQKIDRRLVERLSKEKLEQALDIEEKVKPLEEGLRRLNEEIKRREDEYGKLYSEKMNAEKTLREVEEHRRKLREFSGKIDALKPEIQKLLDKLQLKLDPMNPNLYGIVESSLAMKPEELEEARRELKKRLKELENSRKELEKTSKELTELKETLDMLHRRMKAVGLAEDIADRLRKAVEEVRKVKLREIALRAMRIFEELTDQRVYTNFRIDPENYTVYVSQRGLYEEIPATRVGGGHQTLIALALRLAILEATGGSRLLILDEPTYGVDSQNLPQLIESLAKTVENIGQVILVTHHGLGEEYASNTIKVSVGPDGASTVSQE